MTRSGLALNTLTRPSVPVHSECLYLIPSEKNTCVSIPELEVLNNSQKMLDASLGALLSPQSLGYG